MESKQPTNQASEPGTVQVGITKEELELDLEMYERDEELQLYLKAMRGQVKYEKYKTKLAALQTLTQPEKK